MTQQQIAEMIRNTNGHIFHVRFVKRGNGEVREMTARTGVRKFVKGVGMKYDPAAKGLILVFDLEKMEYRMVPVEGILAVTVDGRSYDVSQAQS